MATPQVPESRTPMTCTEARWLLDNGLEPSSRHPTRARLGFHLAGCTSCRSYREGVHRQLLADLLTEPVNAGTPAAPAKRSRPKRRKRRMRIVGWMSIAAALILTIIIARVAAPALAIVRNVQAYVVPTPTSGIPTSIATIQPQAGATSSVPATPVAVSGGDADLPQDEIADPQVTPNPSRIPIRPTAVGATPIGMIATLPALTATPRVPLAGNAITVLLLGSDRRPGEQGPSRTDTVIIARIDPGLQRVALLSLPRDLVVNIPGYGYGRINAAHVYGDIYPELGGGMALARQTVSDLIGVPIDYAVMIDFEGFIGLIDAIGGIDINVPNALYDGEYPTMNYGYMEVYFEPGMQHMNGSRALQYARIRHMDSDFQRARRQQEVILAAARQLRSQNPLELLDRVASATDSLRGFVWTDMPNDRMIGIAWALRNLSPDTVERYLLDENTITFNGEGGGCSSYDDYWAACSNNAALQQIVKQWLDQ